MRRIIMIMAMAITISLSLNPFTVFAQDANGEKAVLITGATTGIGRLTAEYLAANGYFVYAGARKASDIEDLNSIDNVMAVRLDVTVQEEIDAAVKMIESYCQSTLFDNSGLATLMSREGTNSRKVHLPQGFDSMKK